MTNHATITTVAHNTPTTVNTIQRDLGWTLPSESRRRAGGAELRCGMGRPSVGIGSIGAVTGSTSRAVWVACARAYARDQLRTSDFDLKNFAVVPVGVRC